MGNYVDFYIGLFWIGIVVLIVGLTLRYLFPKYDRYGKDDKDLNIKKLTDNDQDPNGC